MEISVVLGILGTIGCFSGMIGTYVMAKRALSDEAILDKLDMILDEYANNEESMLKLYKIGGVLGKGLRDGIGIDRMIPKRKGGLEGVIFDLIGHYIAPGLGVGSQDQRQAQPQDQTIQPRRNISETWKG